MKNDDDHPFGGPWTEIKLKALSDYLSFYSAALSNQPSPDRPFQRWYIDAFAGSGRRTTNQDRGGLLEGTLSWREQVMLDGSARKAIKIDPPFHHLVFIEADQKRFNALSNLKAEFPERSIYCILGDANVELQRVFQSKAWTAPGLAKGQRGVVFLDPYGMGVKWETLRMLAETQRVDVWYLFPLNAVIRQAARDFDATDDAKRRSLTEIFGDESWKEDLYQSAPAQGGLFDMDDQPKLHRNATPMEIQAYAKKRLQTLFSYVSDPVPLIAAKQPFFSLFCLSNSQSKAATDLIKKGVAHVLKKYTPASHRRFSRQAGDR